MSSLYVLIRWSGCITEGKGIWADSLDHAWEQFYEMDDTLKLEHDNATLEQIKTHGLYDVIKVRFHT